MSAFAIHPQTQRPDPTTNKPTRSTRKAGQGSTASVLVRQDSYSGNSDPRAIVNTIGRRLLKIRDAAQYLALEVTTLYKKSRLREIPCVKVGRSLRFDVRELDRYIEQHATKTID